MHLKPFALLAVVPALLWAGTALGQNRAIERYVAADTDLYSGHPDEGGRPIFDRSDRRNPVFADAGTIVITDGVCGDEWCPLTNGTYLWGGDLCPSALPALPCTTE